VEELSTHTPAVAVIAPGQGLQTGTVARDQKIWWVPVPSLALMTLVSAVTLLVMCLYRVWYNYLFRDVPVFV